MLQILIITYYNIKLCIEIVGIVASYPSSDSYAEWDKDVIFSCMNKVRRRTINLQLEVVRFSSITFGILEDLVASVCM